jgi:hypothetical protein
MMANPIAVAMAIFWNSVKKNHNTKLLYILVISVQG